MASTIPSFLLLQPKKYFLFCIKLQYTHLRYNGGHFVPISPEHGFQICPCYSIGSSECLCVYICVCLCVCVRVCVCVCVSMACRKAAALLTATVGKACRQNSLTPSMRVDRFQVLSLTPDFSSSFWLQSPLQAVQSTYRDLRGGGECL